MSGLWVWGELLQPSGRGQVEVQVWAKVWM